VSRTDFRFYLGAPSLNFSATLGFRRGERIERIPDAATLGRWLDAAGLVHGALPSAKEHADALHLREAIYAVGEAVGRGAPPPAAHVETINAAARAPSPVVQLDPATLAVTTTASRPVRAALALLAQDAVVVFGRERERLGTCADEACGALMLSNSRGPRRRWCSMETCGNRAKVAAYRARQA
jgi:predicted RNA-binding Zn ribbon-like protein